MKRLTLAVLIGGAAFVLPAVASPAVALADPPICHDGILSDDAGQGCADGLYAAVYGHAASSNWAICHDGILSDDVGQGCTNDGPYQHAGRAVVYHASYDVASTGSSSFPSNGYCGAYQFDYSTWKSIGMPGSPCGASPGTQDEAAQRLYAQRGSEPWPVCGRYAPNWAAVRQCENSGSYAP